MQRAETYIISQIEIVECLRVQQETGQDLVRDLGSCASVLGRSINMNTILTHSQIIILLVDIEGDKTG